jgi:hypothetical protein
MDDNDLLDSVMRHFYNAHLEYLKDNKRRNHNAIEINDLKFLIHQYSPEQVEGKISELSNVNNERHYLKEHTTNPHTLYYSINGKGIAFASGNYSKGEKEMLLKESEVKLILQEAENKEVLKEKRLDKRYKRKMLYLALSAILFPAILGIYFYLKPNEKTIILQQQLKTPDTSISSTQHTPTVHNDSDSVHLQMEQKDSL